MLAEERAKGLQLLLATRIPGIKVAGRGVIGMGPAAGFRVGNCRVLFYLDGFKLNEADPKAGDVDLEVINLDELAGVEVYNQANAPVQYKPSVQYCKVVLLWTKW